MVPDEVAGGRRAEWAVVVGGCDDGELLKYEPTQICPWHFLACHIVEAMAVEIRNNQASVGCGKIVFRHQNENTVTQPDFWHGGYNHGPNICWTCYTPIRNRPAKPVGHIATYFLLQNPVLCHRAKCRVGVFGGSDSDAQIRIYSVVWVIFHRIGPMVELMNHPALVQRQIQLLALLPAVALDGVETFGFELRGGAEEVGVIGHVEHGVVPNRPGAALLTPERSTSTGCRS